MEVKHRVLILPGWRNSGADHWQSRWEALHGFERVEQADWYRPLRGDWMARLQDSLLADDRPTALVAHSLGCQLVAAWSAHTRHAGRITGALLVAPPDTARENMPAQLSSWRAIVQQRLPFPSLVVFSTNDPFCAPERAQAMAAGWGASTLNLGPAGHINADAGLADWPAGLALLRQLHKP